MKLLVTTVRSFPAERRDQLVEGLVEAHRRRGDKDLAQHILQLKKRDRIVIESAAFGEEVKTVYEFVKEHSDQ